VADHPPHRAERAPRPSVPTTAPLYRVVRFVLLVYVRLAFGLRVTGAEHVPRGGGCVVASNHFSGWDPFVVGLAVPRQVHFMAKQELFESSVAAWFLRGVGAFPVDRGKNDIGAVKAALRRLIEGFALGIFFEGTRKREAKAVMGGAAYLAQRAGVPLLPTAVWREGRRFHVAFGEPIEPGSSRDDIDAMTSALTQRVRALLPEEAENIVTHTFRGDTADPA
jgi:1-acyl-sn-glycerol-3-phosphate acyltransferase